MKTWVSSEFFCPSLEEGARGKGDEKLSQWQRFIIKYILPMSGTGHSITPQRSYGTYEQEESDVESLSKPSQEISHSRKFSIAVVFLFVVIGFTAISSKRASITTSMTELFRSPRGSVGGEGPIEIDGPDKENVFPWENEVKCYTNETYTLIVIGL